MKSIIRSFFILCLFSTSFVSFLIGQSSLKVISCNQLKSTFEKSGNQQNSNAEFILEKQLIEGVWQKMKVIKNKSSDVLFKSLPKGIYRVSIIPERANTRVTKLHFKGKSNVTNETAVFVSNSIELTGNEIPCPNSSEETSVALRENDLKIRQKKINFFPNPASTQITFNFSSPRDLREGVVIIRDVNGKVLSNDKVSRMANEVTITYLPEGIYFVELLIAEESPVIKKLLVIR